MVLGNHNTDDYLEKEGIAYAEKWKEVIQGNTQACGRIYLATTEIHFAKC